MSFMTGSSSEVRNRTVHRVTMLRRAGALCIGSMKSANRHNATAFPAENPRRAGARTHFLWGLGVGLRPCTRLFWEGDL